MIVDELEVKKGFFKVMVVIELVCLVLFGGCMLCGGVNYEGMIF